MTEDELLVQECRERRRLARRAEERLKHDCFEPAEYSGPDQVLNRAERVLLATRITAVLDERHFH